MTCFFTLEKELRLNVMNYFFESKFFSLDLKCYEKLINMATIKMPIIPLSKNVIGRNLLDRFIELFRMNPVNFI